MGGTALKFEHVYAGKEQPMPLAMVRTGEQVRLVRIHAGRGLQARLASLGMLPGTVFTVVSGDLHGPVVVAVGESRIALGRGMAHKIMVEPAV